MLNLQQYLTRTKRQTLQLQYSSRSHRARGREDLLWKPQQHATGCRRELCSHRLLTCGWETVVEATAVYHSNQDTNAAAAVTGQAGSRLIAEATATRSRGEDTNAAAAFNFSCMQSE